MVLHRVLGGDDQKRLGQGIREPVNRNLVLVHGLEQRRLGLGRGAINLIGQQDVGEDRPRFEFELLLNRGVDRNSQHIAG